ncbi:acyltransferase family protein [Salmonella enterica]|nr:hypothetical protein [Salmonella enterica]EFA3529308.1 acyltransferase family protein [Salmonella enterica]EGL9660061.1 acyltransferase family protein [Salmonella enterica]EHZ0828125.1 acyltransferase family protein [Salmonella enterica]EII7933803.1 acyltransferase family protein [Salmonella enterica]
MAASRHDWIDSLKFLGMFYIYIGHFGADAGKIYPFVFSFHVPLFFFISGLVCPSVKSNEDVFRNIKKAFNSIIIPYFIFSIIGIAFLTIKYSYDYATIQKMIIDSFFGIRNKIPIGSLWFLTCLFIVIIYYNILERLFVNRIFIFLISFFIYANAKIWWSGEPSVMFNADSALYYLAFYSFGTMISNKLINEWVSPSCIYSKIRNYAVLLLSIFVMAYVYFKSAYEPFNGINVVQFQYICYFIITIILFIPSIALSKIIGGKHILLLGRNSILLCGTEQILKLSIASVLSIFGLAVSMKDPMDAVIYTCICFFVSYFTFVKAYIYLKNR